MRANHSHIVEVPFADYILRFIQVPLALGLLGLTAYSIGVQNYSEIDLALFASVWDVVILGYYLVAVFPLPFIYNYLAILITEALTVVFYVATFSSLAALYSRNKGTALLYDNVVIAIIAMSAAAFLLHLATLVMVGTGIQKHRAAGKPLFSDQRSPRNPETSQV